MALKSLFLPPAINIALALFALWLYCWGRGRRVVRSFSLSLLLLSLLSLWLLSTPWLANRLLLSLQPAAWLTPAEVTVSDSLAGGAIVVLGSGVRQYAPEYGRTQPDVDAMVRLHYAAQLQRQTGLPLLLSGGVGSVGGLPQARVMADFSEQQLSVAARWLESRSRSTAENARYSAELLRQQGIEQVVLVTQAYHMRRAEKHFRAAGLQVLAAPTQLADPHLPVAEWAQWLPKSSALGLSRAVIHEYLSLIHI